MLLSNMTLMLTLRHPCTISNTMRSSILFRDTRLGRLLYLLLRRDSLRVTRNRGINMVRNTSSRVRIRIRMAINDQAELLA
jgi:hypothetical protein